MKLLVSIISILVMCSALFADEAESLRKEYSKLQRELNNSEEDYWKSKYKLIEMKQAAKNDLDELENEYDDLMKHRNGIKEEILSMNKDNSKLNEDLDNYKMRTSEIYSTYTTIVNKLTDFVNRHFPFTDEKDLLTLEKIRDRIERKESIVAIGKSINEFYTLKIKDSKESKLIHTDILTKTKVPKKGKKLKMGYVFYGYLTNDSEDAGLLLRTGKVTKRAFKWYEDISSANKESIQETLDSIDKNDKISFLPFDVMQSNAVGKTYAQKESFIKGFTEWFKSGGIVMYAIVFVLCYALFIIIERIVVFRRKQISTGTLMDCVIQELEKKNVDGALNVCKDKKGPLPRMLDEVLTKKKISRRDAQNKLEEFIIYELPKIEKHLPTLKSLGALAPLLGLLGTVTGMISLFDVITSYGTGDPKLLAGGIAEALVTTEFGLIVAIPVVLSHRILLNFADRITSDIERFSITLLNAGWKEKGKR